ncbi:MULTISPECIES: F0F1 ATP synthase subunit delta [unclassified Planococcus (in: firmicutes)]|uniref:F0F1 ATP synthase subunit delta n=1 Tax=Planococcus TaxID=1372 RepID=UPI000C3437C3|nr:MULTISPECIES: F0F1 ATP synthase subunit delta [unclassified Planococcus (in: firmicutes)]MDE4085747.1 F0F1 ATP synthase subunit delta [Planococcus maritimus]AUD14600.1 F0F1 ATP synthase subunit delta [Planococcus sp. MB-3u-03]PKG44900.1 F0F1 ATP synthase subunit delta [Planococcus sp. Urea-trap-24]PKG87243.1 F0F1 ATP synthase subunit delta [Planococcus sp. Urea-3u-39]PKH42368.1 F0F1 ATP synthase subunit delta [Planococcus sp. MB-3u-09]
MSQVAERYASALFQVAKEHNVTLEIEQDLREVRKVFKLTPELYQLIVSPKLSSEKRTNLINEVFQGVNTYVLNTLQMLGERRRMNEVSDMTQAYIKLSNEEQGIEDATVYSTRPLTEEETASLSTAFAKSIGKNSLRIENVIDPSLIGGLRLQIGNRIFDSSVSTKLARLQRQLIG